MICVNTNFLIDAGYLPKYDGSYVLHPNIKANRIRRGVIPPELVVDYADEHRRYTIWLHEYYTSPQEREKHNFWELIQQEAIT